MTDAPELTRDDAPLATSKHGSAAAEAFAATLPEARGDNLLGRSVTINKPAADLYGYFRDFSNLANFMENVVSIEVLDETRSHWVVKSPTGTVEWVARVTEDEPGRLIAWASEDGADVPNSGRVEFREAGARGTVVTATILYDPPFGVVGKVIAKMFQREPNMQARQDLKRFKQLMETGEVATRARNLREYNEEQN